MSKRRRVPPEPQLSIDELAREVEALKARYSADPIKNPTRTVAQMRASAQQLLEGRHAGGRPPLDPEDVRSDRLGIRIHPDLRHELDRGAREEGMRLSMYVERLLIEAVNASAGHRLLDKIGRYLPSPKVSKQR